MSSQTTTTKDLLRIPLRRITRVNRQQLMPQQIIPRLQRPRNRIRPAIVIRDQIRHCPVARRQGPRLQTRLADLEPRAAAGRAGGA